MNLLDFFWSMLILFSISQKQWSHILVWHWLCKHYDCFNILHLHLLAILGVVFIKLRLGKIKCMMKVYCQMSSIANCSGGGWTMVMKIDGKKVRMVIIYAHRFKLGVGDSCKYSSDHWYRKRQVGGKFWRIYI